MRLSRAASFVALGALAAACSGRTDLTKPLPPSAKILTSEPNDPDRTTRYADFEYVEVCTDAVGTADFNTTHVEGGTVQNPTQDLQSLDFSLGANGCRDVILSSAGDLDAVIKEIAPPAGYVFDHMVVHIAPKNVGGVKQPQIEPGTTYTDPTYTISPAANNGGWLIEYFHRPIPGKIGDFVWNDLDQDGIQDAGEPGIPGVTLSLFSCSDLTTPVATTTSDGAGAYLFDNLALGCYTVKSGTPSGFAPTLGGQGTASTDSDNPGGVSSTVTPGSNDPTLDFGFVVMPPPGANCSFTIGYWKTHAGFGPQGDAVTPLLPVWLGAPNGAKSILVSTAALVNTIEGKSLPGAPASNGFSNLYAQLLAAKLSIKSGASNSAIAALIATADAYLATHNQGDWAGLSKAQQAQVNAWGSTLDDYNNGRIGPGHCN